MHHLAFHLDKTVLKAALVSKKGKIEYLYTFDDLDHSPLSTLKPLLVKKKIKIISGIEASDLFLREISLKLTHRSAINKALPFQIESLIPFPIEEAIVQPILRKIDKKTTSVTLFSTRRQHLEQHLIHLQRFGIDPDQVSCIPVALYHYAKFAAPASTHLVVFHLGEEKSNYICIVSDQLTLSQTINIGKIDLIESENSNKIEQFQKELQRMSAYIDKKFSCSTIMITGSLSQDNAELMKNILGSQFSFVEHEYPAYAIALGLSLEKIHIQFRQAPYQPPQAKKRQRKMIFSYLAACLSLSLILSIGGSILTKKREETLLNSLHLDSLDKRDLSSTLDSLEKSLKSQKKPSPFALTVPLVSDFLFWISTHPKLEGIEITRVQYKLNRFPKIGKENDPYEAKVELEFKAITPRKAREFHEILIAGDSIINAKQPIAWTTEENHYFTSFFLKNISGIK